MSANQPPSETDGPSSIGFRRRREKRERAMTFLAGKPLIVGLDLAKKRHAVWVAGADLSPIRRFMVDHSIDGLVRLLEEVERDRAAGGFDRVIVFMEPTSHFWENVVNFLEARETAYRLVSPLAVARQREIEHITFAKGDYRDAEIIVRLGAGGQWIGRILERDPLWIELRVMALEHEELLRAECEERMRVRSFLELVLPELFNFFGDPLCNTVRAMIRKLSSPASELPRTYADIAARTVKVEGLRLRQTRLRALVARLRAAPSFGVERLLAPTLVRLGFSVARFEFLSEQSRELHGRLAELYARTQYQKVLDTIPGVAPETHAVLLGLTGDPRQFDRASCLVKLAGMEPRENHSGQQEGRHSISRRGRSAVRNIVYRITLGLLKGNPEFTAYIARLRSRPKNPLVWYQAAVAAGNKYLRLVHRMCMAGEPYDPSRVVPRG